jgi:hypothetical protein
LALGDGRLAFGVRRSAFGVPGLPPALRALLSASQSFIN